MQEPCSAAGLWPALITLLIDSDERLMLIIKLEQQQDITGKDKYNILSLYNLERSTYQDDGRVLNKRGAAGIHLLGCTWRVWIKTYFLKRCRSSAPSDVVFTVTFSISIHSFSRGSPVRSPVDLRACREKEREREEEGTWWLGQTWQQINKATSRELRLLKSLTRGVILLIIQPGDIHCLDWAVTPPVKASSFYFIRI